MASKETNSLGTDRSASQHLKAKSRENLVRVAAPPARPRQCYERSRLLTFRWLTFASGRRVRVNDPARVRQVASSISAIGFACRH